MAQRGTKTPSAEIELSTSAQKRRGATSADVAEQWKTPEKFAAAVAAPPHCLMVGRFAGG
jgi:hypothetical protein